VTGAEQSNKDRVALGELINAGLVTYDADARGQRPALSDEAVDSLRVDSTHSRTGRIPRHGGRAEAERRN
jgi:hypothetical protein